MKVLDFLSVVIKTMYPSVSLRYILQKHQTFETG